MLKFVLCGSGWRAGFYKNIAKAFPDRFSISAIYTRQEDRKNDLLKEGYFATNDLGLALGREHNCVIVSSGPIGFLALLEELSQRKEVIATETTFSSLSEEELSIAEKIDGYTLEQYWFTPLYASIWSSLSYIGKVDSVYLSALHKHHAAAICRRIFPQVAVKESKTLLERSSLIATSGSRYGLIKKKDSTECKRTIKMVELSNGGVFINDFTSGQYHSYITPSRIEIRGEKGVVTERGVTYIDDKGYPIDLPFIFNRDSSRVNQSLTLSHVTLGSDVIYENEFYPSSLNDDEIAIAKMLRLLEDGKLNYTIADGVKDARLGVLL